MESSYNEAMLHFDLSYLNFRNQVPKKTHTKESFLRLKKKVINTDALLQSHKQLKNDLMKARNECKQIRVDYKETTERLRSVQNENEKLKNRTNEMLQKQNYDSLQVQGLESYIKQLQELLAEKDVKMGAIELEKQLLISSLQDQKKEHKKSLRSNIKEKNRHSSDTVASFTGSDFEIEHAYSIDTGCGSSIASITSPDYCSNNSPMSIDCLNFQKSTSVVSVATSPIEFLTSVSKSEPEHVAVETDSYEHATSTECSLNVPTEPDPPKICDEYTSTQSLSRLNKPDQKYLINVTVQTEPEPPKIVSDKYTSTHTLLNATNEAVESDANDSTQSLSRLNETDQKYLINVAVQTEPEPPKIISDKYTSTQTLLNATNEAVESDANDVTIKEKNTLVEDMEVQSILRMMTMTFPAISPIPPSPVMLKDASTQCCSENHYGINCSIEVLPSASRLETCLNVTPINSNTNKSNRKQTDLPLPANNDRLNDCSRKSPPKKQILKGKQINDIKDSKIQKKNHDLGLSESDSDIDDGPNLNEILNTNVSNKTYSKYKNLKEITLSKVNSYIKSYDVHDANKNVLRKKPEVHISENNSIQNSQPEKTVETPNTRKYLLPSVSVQIKKLSFKDIEKFTLIQPFDSNKGVTCMSCDSGHSSEEIVKDLDDNLRSSPEKTVESPKASKELFSPVSNNSDCCVTNKRVLPKRISSASKDTILRKKYEDLGLESDSELSNADAAEIHEAKNTDVSENHVRILRSKSSRQSTLLSKTSNSENQRPVRNLKRKSVIKSEFANKRVLRNSKTMTHNSGPNNVDRINYLNESYVQVDNPSVTLRKTRQGSLSNKKPICKRTLRRHKDSENNGMEITEIKLNSPRSRYSKDSENNDMGISEIKPNSPKSRYSKYSENNDMEISEIKPNSPKSRYSKYSENNDMEISEIKPNSPKSRYSRSSESESELTHQRVLRSMSSPNGMSCGSPDKNFIVSQNSNLQIVPYLTRYRLKRLSVENEEMKSLTNVSPVILQENKGDLQSPLKNKMAANDTILSTRSKRLSTYFSPTKKPASISNSQQTLHMKDATIISESTQEDKGDLQVEKCREYSNIENIPLSMVVSYSDLDIFTNCNDTPPTPKNAPSAVNKSCHKLNSFFWEMLEKYCGQFTFKRKSHLLTDSAVNTLCETLEVNIARIIELPDGLVLFEMKELANTVCNENRKILISAVLEYLMSPKRQFDTECRKYTPPAPIMSKQEQVLLFVLDYIRVQCKYNIFYDILKSIEFTLFRLNHTPEFVHVENLSHFYAVICRFVGSVVQLRTFLIDAMYCMSYKAIIVANQCLNVWMHTLPLAHLRNAKNPLVVCIVYLLYFFKCEANPNIVDGLRNTLVKRYFYEMTEWNETKLLQFIRTCITSIKNNPLETKNMRCCLVLLAKREGVTWCQKNIIEKMLMPIINDPSTPERIKRFCISILGPIMRPYPNNMKIQCEIVIDKLITIVNTQSCSHNMEETIFRSLIFLNKHNTHKVTRALLSWMPREEVSNEFYSLVVEYIEGKPSTAWLKILKQNYY